MLTNLYIERVLRQIQSFKGVFSSDNCPLLKHPGESIIINFDRVNEGGSHFVAIYLHKKDELRYFDSLDIPLLPPELNLYLEQYPKILDCSKQIQSFSSTYCGFYCMLFILSNIFDVWGKTINFFLLDKIENDHMCIELLCCFLKKYHKK